MEKISLLKSPAIAGVVKESTALSAIAEIKNCICDGADMIDLHMSCLNNPSEEELRKIALASRLPILALNYNKKIDDSYAGYTEEMRAELFLRAVDCGVAGVDMQGYTFDEKSKNGFFGENAYSFTKNNPNEVVTDENIIAKQREFIEKVHNKGAEVLLSCHPGIAMNAEQIVELALFLEKRNPDIIKIVSVAEREEDLIEAFKAMSLLKKEVKTKVSYHASGKAGELSRIINPILGGHIAFCVDRYTSASTMEQLDLRTVRSIVDNIKMI